MHFSADGNYEVTLMTKATLSYTGEVVWKPPSIYKSSCEINVQYFPFDEQSCLMRFGSWTFGIRREDHTLRQYTSVIDCILPPLGRNHSADIVSSAIIGQISLVYYESCYDLNMGHCMCSKCIL